MISRPSFTLRYTIRLGDEQKTFRECADFDGVLEAARIH
jgi:hypothetical protein